MIKSQEELRKEEQRFLDALIEKLDARMFELDQNLTAAELKAKKAKDMCLPDTYGMLVEASYEKAKIKESKRDLRSAKNQLYQEHVILELQSAEDMYVEKQEFAIGLHAYAAKGDVYILSWKSNICRKLVTDPSTREYDCEVTDKYGITYKTHVKLHLRRQVDIFFDEVENVTQLFPIEEKEQERIVSDAFLQELLRRRSGEEFRNIVFSIQEHQGKIIQAPFRTNIIVQGCAGSGKSMIMLHRLPIILFDNPDSLDRNNLYIITPSVAYMQMANNMRIDLEIQDLKMGTLNQYYDYVIQKYNHAPNGYGRIRYDRHLSTEQIKYVYSEECIQDIRNEFCKAIEEITADCNTENLFWGQMQSNAAEGTFLQDIRQKTLQCQTLIDNNESILEKYRRVVLQLVEQNDPRDPDHKQKINPIKDLGNALISRKAAIKAEIHRRIEAFESEKKLINQKLGQINLSKKKKDKQVYLDHLVEGLKETNHLRDIERDVDNNHSFFDSLKKEGERLLRLHEYLNQVKTNTEKPYDRVYALLDKKDILLKVMSTILKELLSMEDPYPTLIQPLNREIKVLQASFVELRRIEDDCLPMEEYKQLLSAVDRLSALEKSIVKKTYMKIMSKLGQKTDQNKQISALTCSPYLYLQILYCFQGEPNAAKESLITIDEAQTIEPSELRLIKAVNGNTVIFNLFGDVKQHIENSKGVDRWNAFATISDFRYTELKENYRNARQITEYCNQRFGIKMQAINLDGDGVHTIEDMTTFQNTLRGVFGKPQKPGLSSVIVKNEEEAVSFISLFSGFEKRFNNMAVDFLQDLRRDKWNVLTVDQAKGLEFETVIAVSGRMSQNEKYIAYTRALNELFVFEQELPVTEKVEESFRKILGNSKKNLSERPQRENRPVRNERNTIERSQGMDVKTFFINAGLEVVDHRYKNGCLWVVGSKEQINDIVQEAVQRFGISGAYTKGKEIKYRDGWYTKTKK